MKTVMLCLMNQRKIIRNKHGWRNLFQSVVHTCTLKRNYCKFCGLNWLLWRHKDWNMTSLHIHHMKVLITLFYTKLHHY